MNKVPLKNIFPDENQPRKYFDGDKLNKLKDSIKKNGILNPLIVEKQGANKYLLVDGERRFRAATELGLKEVPIVEFAHMDPISRAIQQFHIQEQHEAWSPTEKAEVIYNLSQQTGKSIKELAQILGIAHQTAREYISFANLVNKKAFIEGRVTLRHASCIKTITKFAKDLKEQELEQPFTQEESQALETNLIERFKNGELTKDSDYSIIKDIIKQDPKQINILFKDTKISLSEAYVKTKAKSHTLMRKNYNYMKWAGGSLNAVLKDQNATCDHDTLAIAKNLQKLLKQFIETVTIEN
jgi:ParB family transcriptional regulator, chromosome partitioning protein